MKRNDIKALTEHKFEAYISFSFFCLFFFLFKNLYLPVKQSFYFLKS